MQGYFIQINLNVFPVRSVPDCMEPLHLKGRNSQRKKLTIKILGNIHSGIKLTVDSVLEILILHSVHHNHILGLQSGLKSD